MNPWMNLTPIDAERQGRVESYVHGEAAIAGELLALLLGALATKYQ